MMSGGSKEGRSACVSAPAQIFSHHIRYLVIEEQPSTEIHQILTEIEFSSPHWNSYLGLSRSSAMYVRRNLLVHLLYLDTFEATLEKNLSSVIYVGRNFPKNII